MNELEKAKQIAREYNLPYSDIDAGSLYWALHVALAAIEQPSAGQSAEPITTTDVVYFLEQQCELFGFNPSTVQIMLTGTGISFFLPTVPPAIIERIKAMTVYGMQCADEYREVVSRDELLKILGADNE